MPTLNENFEAWYCEAFETTPSRMRDDQKHYDCNRSGFLAGAKAEREEVLEIIRNYMTFSDELTMIERQIKERDNG